MSDQTAASWLVDEARAVWRRRKWLALIGFILPLSATIGLVPFLPKLYSASAVILVERQRVPESFVRSTVTTGLETRLQTIGQDILSRERLEELITRFNLYRELKPVSPIEAIVDRMRRDINVELRGVQTTVRGGSLVAFTVRYTGRDPDTVSEVANTLASFYLDGNSKARERQASSTAEFLRRQVDDVKERLELHERRLSAFKVQHVGETPQHMQENLAMLDRLNTQLRLNSERQSRAMERREMLSRQVAEAEALAGLMSDPAVGASAAPAPASASAVRLEKLKHELRELLTRFSDKYPDVVELKSRIAALEKQVGEQRSSEPNKPSLSQESGATFYVLQVRQALGEVEAELKSLREEERRVQSDLALYHRRLEKTPYREQEYQALSRDYGTTNELYQTLRRRLEEAQLAESMEQGQQGEQFRVLEPAVRPDAPVAPRRGVLLALGVVASLAIAAGVALLAEQLDTSFHTVDHLRAFTATPVLVSIPRIVTSLDVRDRRRRAALVGGATAIMSVLLIGSGYLVAKGAVPMLSQVILARVLNQ